jgi:outer membrane protein
MKNSTYGCRCRPIMAGLLLAGAILMASDTFADQNSVVSGAGAVNSVSSSGNVGMPSGGPSTVVSGASAGAVAAAAPAAAEPIVPGSQLTLEQAIKIAIKYFPRLHEREAQRQAAEEEVGVARSALGPQLYGVSQYLRSTHNGIGNTSYYDPLGIYPRMTGRNHNLPADEFSQSWNTDNNYMNGLAISQFLFDFGRRRGYVAQRRFEARAASKRAQVSQLRLIFEVSQRYYDLLRGEQLVRVYEKAVEQRKFHLHEAQVKASAGLRPQLDVYLTTAEVERAELHLVDARNAVADAKVALDNAMGLSDSAPTYQLAQVLTYSPIREKLGSLMATAFHVRPDLQMLEDEARAMGARVTEYRSDYYPSISAVGGYAGMSTGLPVVNNFNVGIVITWPIFNSFQTTHQMDEAKFEQQAAQHAIEDLHQRVILEVKTAFLNWQASLARIQRAEKALAASRAQLELAEKRYQAGLSDIVELEDAQRHYTYDDAEYANSLYGYSIAKAAVDEATGSSLSGL